MTMTPEVALHAALRGELHTCAQPLSVLQCRLELASLAGQERELREAISGALADLRGVTESLNRLRTIASAMSSMEVQ
jgi:hypothetical protein